MIKRWLQPSRKSQSGQALVETAFVIFIFVILVIGFVGEGLQVAARVQVQSAAQDAAISALQAPLGNKGGYGVSPAGALNYAENTFFSTMRDEKWVTATMNGCDWQEYFNSTGNEPACTTANGDNPDEACSGNYLNGLENAEGDSTLTCQITDISVNYGQEGPLSLIWPNTVSLAPVTVTVTASSYRTCYEGASCLSS